MLMSNVEFYVLCVEVSLGCHVVIGVGRVIVQRHHADTIPIIEFSLLVHFCTCSQTACCDRQFFPVAIYCTLLHRENGSFEVLCLQCQEASAKISWHHVLVATSAISRAAGGLLSTTGEKGAIGRGCPSHQLCNLRNPGATVKLWTRPLNL